MTDRDDELARALGELPVPEHAADFWARLEQRLDDPTAAPLGPAPPARAAAGHADQQIIVHDTHPGAGEAPVVPLYGERSEGAGHGRSRSDRGGGRRALLAAAAAVVALAGGTALVTRWDGDDGDDVVTVADDGSTSTSEAASTLEAPAPPEGGSTPAPTEQPPTTGPSTAAAPAGDPTAIGTVEPVGPGLVVGALPAADATPTVLVRDLLPGDEVGCEGAPLEGLEVLTDDGSSRPVLSDEGTAIVNGADVHASPGGERAAVVSQCEGFLGQLLVGDVGSDGVPTGLQVVAGTLADGSPVPGAPEIEGVPSVTWTPDGGRLLVTTVRFTDGGAERALWSYDVATGTWSERADAPAGVVAAVERRDGSLVALTGEGLVIGGDAQPRRGANGLTLGPDGMTVAAYGSDGVVLIDDSGGARFLTSGQVSRAEFLPDGSWLALARFSEAEERNEIATVPVGGPQAEAAVLGTSVWGWFEVLPDASGLLVSVDGEIDTEGFSRPAVERWPFAAR